MSPRITEDSFEYYVLDDLLAGLGTTILPGLEIAPGEPDAVDKGILKKTVTQTLF